MANNLSGPSGNANDGCTTLPVYREELQVGTRTVDTGRGVRIHKSVSEHPQHIEHELLHDGVDVKRVAVDKVVALSEAPVARQEGDTFIVPVLEEVLVVEKRLRIKEELHITRTQRSQRHADTVVLRTEDVSIERFDDGTEPAMNPTTRR